MRRTVDGQPNMNIPSGVCALRLRVVSRTSGFVSQPNLPIFNILVQETGKATVPAMGCYGIGVSRVVAAAIEQNHDDNGILWPDAIAPFQIALVPIGYGKSDKVRETMDRLYSELVHAGFDVLLDDRDERPGVIFADMDLIGIPHRLVVGDKGLAKGTVEYKGRRNNQAREVQLDQIIRYMQETVNH